MSAIQVQFLQAGIQYNGAPLSAGLVYTYASGTTTPKTAWTDKDKGSTAANPFVLDAEGRGSLFCDGSYKFVVKTADGLTTVATYDGQTFGVADQPNFEFLASYGTLAAAVAAIGATPTVLYLDTTDTLAANITVPSTLTLMPIVKDALDINGFTLTINGPVFAPPLQWIKDSNVTPGTLAGTPITYFWNPIWVESGTLTDSHVYYTSTGKEIATLSGISSATTTGVTVTSTETGITSSINCGSVKAGDIALVEFFIQATKGGTTGKSAYYVKPGGTATVVFGKDNSTLAFQRAIASGDVTADTLLGLLTVTVAGTLTLALYGTSANSDSTVASGNGDVKVTWIKKQ